ncbi:hypothetical protein [Calycomorphotria hydatis]|uniref:Uncharacterized protein n=1 Tax=Calycomorphotria hydatis TaxID=2528027 RepID=A0A517TAE7_9PLAN|nr:hypothetical protein [Calycomorphotria hydatis]QDT65350.1 hypothetical protein V22_25990 [Calycomorphotria hydatis]
MVENGGTRLWGAIEKEVREEVRAEFFSRELEAQGHPWKLYKLFREIEREVQQRIAEKYAASPMAFF